MKLVIDEKHNIAYIYLNEKLKNQIVETKEMYGINIDYAKDGTVVGIEFLDAKEQLKNLIRKDKISFAFQNISRMAKPMKLEMV